MTIDSIFEGNQIKVIDVKELVISMLTFENPNDEESFDGFNLKKI